MRAIQEGTEKLHVLTVLHEEKNHWDGMLTNQAKLRQKKQQQDEGKVDFAKDLDGLRLIVREQDKQIEFLQREIRTLSLKCKPFSSVPVLPAIVARGSSGSSREQRRRAVVDSDLSTTGDDGGKVEVKNANRLIDENSI